MNKRLLACIIICVHVCAAGSASAAGIQQLYGVVNSGSGTGTSGSYVNTVNVGQGGSTASGTNFRSYSGVLALQVDAPAMQAVTAIDNSMVFSDPSPTSAQDQSTDAITFMFTLSVGGGNTIGSVTYGLSHTAGLKPALFALTAANIVADLNPSVPNTRVRYKITFPNADAGALRKSDDNYIWCFATNNAGSDAIPAIFQVRVSPDASSAVVITQPDAKGGFSGTLPLIAATIANPSSADAASVQIRLNAPDGSTVLSLSSAQHPDIFDAVSGVVSYKYAGAPLVVGRSYDLTVSANYPGWGTETAAVSFVVKDGAIADLIPYPSPCDPAVQPVTIRYILNQRADVSVNLFDMAGRLIKVLVSNEPREPGINEETWRADNFAGADLANGIYFCEVVARDSDGEHRRYTSLAIFGK